MSATTAREDGKGQEVIIDTEAPSIAETWKAMVKLLDTGKVKAVSEMRRFAGFGERSLIWTCILTQIGVSNFTIKHLEILAAASDVIPYVQLSLTFSRAIFVLAEPTRLSEAALIGL